MISVFGTTNWFNSTPSINKVKSLTAVSPVDATRSIIRSTACLGDTPFPNTDSINLSVDSEATGLNQGCLGINSSIAF